MQNLFSRIVGLIRFARVDRIALTGSVLALVSLLMLPWLTIKPNRLATGQALTLLNVLQGRYWLLLLFAIAVTVLALLPSARAKRFLLALSGNLYLFLGALATSLAASEILTHAGPNARVSLSSAAWLSFAGGYLVVYAAGVGLRGWALLVTKWAGLLGIVVLAVGGNLNSFSIIQEYFTYRDTFLAESVQHLLLVAVALAVGLLIGLALGIWSAYSSRVAAPVLTAVSLIQIVPSLALFGLLIVPLADLGQAVPVLGRLGVRGIGPAPAITALVLYSLLPIVRNTYTGLQAVDPDVREAGRGMGLTRRQILYYIELPLALPVIVEGIRISAVSLVGLAALVSLIGAGGMGTFIFQGIGQAAPDLVLLGVLPVISLAVIINTFMRYLYLRSVPRGLRTAT